MRKNIGILHVYLKSPGRPETCIVGDEQGLYDLWKAVAEAMIGRKGQAAFRTTVCSTYAKASPYASEVSGDRSEGKSGDRVKVHDFIILRVDRKSHILKKLTS